jgi:hypothetical protein
MSDVVIVEYSRLGTTTALSLLVSKSSWKSKLKILVG